MQQRLIIGKSNHSSSLHSQSQLTKDLYLRQMILSMPDEVSCYRIAHWTGQRRWSFSINISKVLLLIAEHFNPPIPFELGHFTLPSRYTRLGRQELRALAGTCRKFARMFRPFVTRTLTFQDRGRRTNTVQLFNSEKAVQESVQEVYWEVRCLDSSSFRGLEKQDWSDDVLSRVGISLLQRCFTVVLDELEEPHLPDSRFLASADVSSS